MDATTVAVDLAKDVFQVSISRSSGQVAVRRRLSRRQFALFVESLSPGTTVVMETCGTAHYWGRRCLARGAQVRLLPAHYVRPYVRRDKTDRADADALLEANRCAAIHPVPVKTIEQQTIQEVHRIREQWQRTRTARINGLRAILREHGIVVTASAKTIEARIRAIVLDPSAPLPLLLTRVLDTLLTELRTVTANVEGLDRELGRLARTHPIVPRLLQIPGIGVITATALIGAVPHIHAFRRGRQFASWLGLTPWESSSGLRRKIGTTSKRGNTYLRALLVHGARSALRAAELRVRQTTAAPLQRWAVATAQRRGRNRATVALANKLARIVWAVWTRDVDFSVA